ncbi:alpha/beta fold hydrolase [Enterococcus sp. LJL128]
MDFVVSGQYSSPKVLLIHAMLNDSTCFDDLAEKLKEKYCVIRPTLDGHDGNTEFSSLNDQVNKIVQYLTKYNCCELEFIMGSSLGALVALGVSRDSTIKVKQTILDGIPFFKFGKVIKSIAKVIFLQIWKKSRKQPDYMTKKFEASFPGRGERMVKITSTMTKSTIERLVEACYSNDLFVLNKTSQKNFHFLFGSKEPARFSIRRIKKTGNVDIQIFNGYGHCEYINKYPNEYIEKIFSILKQFPTQE